MYSGGLTEMHRWAHCSCSIPTPQPMKAPRNLLAHWHHSAENLSTSALEFYTALERALVEKQAPNVVVERVDWEESGVLSTRREYLRISYGRLSFDICAAPFGKDYLFSWWLVRRLPHWLFALLGI